MSMAWRSFGLSLVGSLWLGGTATYADDMAFGADTLPLLSRSADVIVTVAQADQTFLPPLQPSDDKPLPLNYSGYVVTVGERIAGDVDPGAEIRVAVPEEIDFLSFEELVGKILFLRTPDADSFDGTNIPPDRGFYILVTAYPRVSGG